MWVGLPPAHGKPHAAKPCGDTPKPTGARQPHTQLGEIQPFKNTYKHTYAHIHSYIHAHRDRETEWQTDRRTDRQAGR